MRLKKRIVEVSLYGIDSGSATDSFTEHAIAKLRAVAAKMESYRRLGFKLRQVQRDNPLKFVLENPGPREALRLLKEQLDQNIRIESVGIHNLYRVCFSSRVEKVLVAAGITKLRDLVVRTENDLLYGDKKVKGLGMIGISEIRTQLDRHNLRLGMEL